ncbi:TatD family hydrolase [Desulfovibrio inopinatus]|uniref:TatD family hydrolase n=1 Tax=Desulfovibrio inopinatus TaxID=102109 RepID=UPI0003FEE8F8|nr:TatD family hydrolase [Desulfovibrio inopinatus]
MAKKKNRPEPASLGLPCVGVETHAHLDYDANFEETLLDTISRAHVAGVARLGNVFLGPDKFNAHASAFNDIDEVFFLLGVHPNDVVDEKRTAVADMATAFDRESRLVAVGEIGLDYYWDRSPQDLQKQFFREQLAFARERGVPAVIHSRDAFEDTITVLDDMNFRDHPLIWHCFNGDVTMAEAILERGWYISIPGPVSYSKNTALANAAATIPLERMLIETDSPFLSPEPYRGKPNEPSYLVFTAQKIAMLREMETAELWRKTGQNAIDVFGLDPLT